MADDTHGPLSPFDKWMLDELLVASKIDSEVWLGLDYWSTIVHWKTPPWEVRLAICKRVAELVKTDLAPEDLFGLLQDSARALASSAQRIGLDYEYQVSSAWIATLGPLGVIEDRQALSASISDIEIELLVENTYVVPAVRQALSSLKRGWGVISDNEYSEQQLDAVSRRHNLEIPKIFVSSESGNAKRSGKLFDVCARNLNVSLDHMWFLGDNQQSDYLIPRNLGVRVPRRKPPMGGAEIPSARLENHKFDSLDEHQLGLSLGHYIVKLREEIALHEEPLVLFVGSEGAFFSRFFEERNLGDSATYVAVSMGRREFLKAATRIDPSWVMQRLLISDAGLVQIGSLFEYSVKGSDPEADIENGRSIVAKFWENGSLDLDGSGSTLQSGSRYLASFKDSLGVQATHNVVIVVDVGYRNTVAQAFALVFDGDVRGTSMFIEAGYSANREFRGWGLLEMRATEWPVRSGKWNSGENVVPKVPLPVEVLLAAGPRAPKSGVHVRNVQNRLVGIARAFLASNPQILSGDVEKDVDAWSSLMLRPRGRLARGILLADHGDDLREFKESNFSVRRIYRSACSWPMGANRSLPFGSAEFLFKLTTVIAEYWRKKNPAG